MQACWMQNILLSTPGLPGRADTCIVQTVPPAFSARKSAYMDKVSWLAPTSRGDMVGDGAPHQFFLATYFMQRGWDGEEIKMFQNVHVATSVRSSNFPPGRLNCTTLPHRLVQISPLLQHLQINMRHWKRNTTYKEGGGVQELVGRITQQKRLRKVEKRRGVLLGTSSGWMCTGT